MRYNFRNCKSEMLSKAQNRASWTCRAYKEHLLVRLGCKEYCENTTIYLSYSFIDHIKANLLMCNIKPSDLKALASDRDIWRTVCDTGLRSLLNGLITASEERRAARHTASTKPKTGPRCPQCSRVCASDFGLRIHMRSHVKTGNT